MKRFKISATFGMKVIHTLVIDAKSQNSAVRKAIAETKRKIRDPGVVYFVQRIEVEKCRITPTTHS